MSTTSRPQPPASSSSRAGQQGQSAQQQSHASSFQAGEGQRIEQRNALLVSCLSSASTTVICLVELKRRLELGLEDQSMQNIPGPGQT